jgi:hypothetical protein
MRNFNLAGSTDSNWIFDASAFQNDGNRLNSLDPTEKYNFNGEPMNSGGSDSIYENFAQLKKKNRKQSNKMAISIPNNYGVFEDKYSVSPKMGNDSFPFEVKQGHVSALSGMISREDNPANLLFSINESIRKNVSARPRKKKKKVEEEIIDELFSNKRNPDKFANISNLSAVRKKKPPRKKVRKRRSAFKGINPNQVYQEMARMKTNQREKQELQEKIIDNSCQITKKGKADIEKMVKFNKTKTSMIYSEIDSAHSDELADTVKPLDFGGRGGGDILDRRKLTFGMKFNNELMKDGQLDIEELQRKFLENSQLKEEIRNGINDNFGQEMMNKSDIPKLKKKKKKRKVGSMMNLKLEKKSKKKEKKKETKSGKNLKKRKNSKRNLKETKKKNKSKRKLNKKKMSHASSRVNFDKVISRYGIPLISKKDVTKDKDHNSKKRINKNESKVRFSKKKRNSILVNSGLNLKGKPKKESKKGKKKIKAKNFKGMREQNKFDSDEDSKEQVNKDNKRSKKKKISIHKKKKKTEESPFKGKFGLHMVESETLHSEEGDNILIKGLNNGLKILNTEEKLGANKDHRNQVIAEYNMDRQKTPKDRKNLKNDFVDKDLIDQLRNEPSSDEDDIMKGIYSKESNLINGINPSLLKKSIQPKNQKDNTVINLNYSGDSDGFIDGNISEQYLSDDDRNEEMKDYLINGSKVNTESIRHTSIGQDLRKREKMNSKVSMKPNNSSKRKQSKEVKPEEISQIMSGLKNQLSLIEFNGGLTGLKNQNPNLKNVRVEI